jgi:hypothetical protein
VIFADRGITDPRWHRPHANFFTITFCGHDHHCDGGLDLPSMPNRILAVRTAMDCKPLGDTEELDCAGST